MLRTPPGPGALLQASIDPLVAIATLGIVNLYSATSVYSGARAEQYVNQV